jgi:tRNA A22 N-methylase
MRLRRRVVITAEKTETYTVRQEPPQSLQAHCEKCDQTVRCLTVDQTVNVTGLGARTIFRLVEAGELHCYETVKGHLLLCPNTVALFVQLGATELTPIS